ncbi:MAG: hypothetical protein ACRCUF_17945 [Aeromonas sobria]
MKVDFKLPTPARTFGLVHPTECFVLQDVAMDPAYQDVHMGKHVWMKLAAPSHHLAVNLHNGTMLDMKPETLVIPVNVKVVNA